MLRSTLLAAARSPQVRAVVESGPFDPLVSRFVAGATAADALATARVLTLDRLVTLDHLGEDIAERAQADANVAAYEHILGLLGDAGLADRVEVSVKLSAFGQSLETDGDKIALEGARRVCAAAAAVGTTVTVDMEDHTTTDRTLETVRELRVDHPWVGAVVQAHLRRTEADCHDLAGPGLAGAAVQGRLRRARVGGLPRAGRASTRPSHAAWACSPRGRGCRWWRPTTRA